MRVLDGHSHALPPSLVVWCDDGYQSRSGDDGHRVVWLLPGIIEWVWSPVEMRVIRSDGVPVEPDTPGLWPMGCGGNQFVSVLIPICVWYSCS